MFVADLHLHSRFSDGTYDPGNLLDLGKKLHLSIISITDHDTVEGYQYAESLFKAKNIFLIPGTEITAEYQNNEIHLLGYFIDCANQKLLKSLAEFQKYRCERIREIVKALNKLSIPLEAETVFLLANCKAPGRPHVARALVKRGFCNSYDEAFERFLRKNKPAWVPKFKTPIDQAIKLIHEAGGLAILAHPGLNKNDELIPIFKEMGLDGIECFHSKHSESMQKHYIQIAKQLGLLVTGGSDCHGFSRGKPVIGTTGLPTEYIAPIFEKVNLMVPDFLKLDKENFLPDTV
jgi:predicted metal-dependent phosphoesterase TrpH